MVHDSVPCGQLSSQNVEKQNPVIKMANLVRQVLSRFVAVLTSNQLENGRLA